MGRVNHSSSNTNVVSEATMLIGMAKISTVILSRILYFVVFFYLFKTSKFTVSIFESSMPVRRPFSK